jgi:class 3 adenylate cyclase
MISVLKYLLKKKRIPVEKYSGEGTVLISFVTQLDQAISNRSPEELVEMLKAHLATQASIIERNSGIVLLYEGDSVLAFWPKELAQPDTCRCAFESAQAMLQKVHKAFGFQVVLGTGRLAGDYFGPKRQYQVVGPAMNIADKLSKFRYPAHRVVLLTEATKMQLSNSGLSFQVIGKLGGEDILAYTN